MEKAKRSRRALRHCTKQQRDFTRDVPEELIQYIQSLLPLKEAARTSVLSKSWLHAWSTIPTLRFQHEPSKLITDTKYKEPKYLKLINRTLRRYRRDNIPVVSFKLDFHVHDQKSVSLIDKWVRKVAASKSSALKELYLTLAVAYNLAYTLPDEIFSSENLHTISATHDIIDAFCTPGRDVRTGSLWTSSSNIRIRCVNLRVLELVRVHISEEVLDKIFSTCTLLEKINLMFQNEYKTLKVKDLRYLQELKITQCAGRGILEISNVPNIRLFHFYSSYIEIRRLLWVSKDSLGSLRELFLAGVVIGNELLDIFKSNSFPVLEILSLYIEDSKLKILDITCTSLQRFVTRFLKKIEIDIQVCSPSLVFFRYIGEAMPGLSFPIIVPDQIVLQLELKDPVDHSFFLKMRETLNLSSNFKIMIQSRSRSSLFTLPFSIDDVRLRVTSPATNVERLTFYTNFRSNPSALLDAIFSICHPKYLQVYDNRVINTVIDYLRELIRRRVVGRKSQKDYYCWSDLKDVEVSLTSSWTSVSSRPIPENCYSGFLRLTWRSRGSCSLPSL